MNQVVLIALRRPYTFVVLAILILLFGSKAILQTPTDVFPNIRIPVISVVWVYRGLLPRDVSGRITYYYERWLTSTVEGIQRITSHSYYGSSIINIFLQPETNLAGAEAEVAAISQTVVKALPPDISPPMIMRLEASSVPVAMLQVTSDKLSPADLYNVSVMHIRPLLITIPGAILPHPYGGMPKQLLVSLDQQKLLARKLTPEDVHKAFRRQDLVLPAGDQKIQATDWMVQSNAMPLKVEDFNNIPIKREGNAYIFLRDVADVDLAGPPQTNAVLVEGKQAVIIVVMKSGEASTLDVVDGVKEAIPKIEKTVPGDVKIKLLSDASVFVKDSIWDVLREMATAAVLTALVVLLLLGSWRSTLIVATSIPLAILSSLIGLHLSGESINIMTLGGLALAVGILVDDATVMIENIDTHVGMGKDLEQAIIDAANQIVIPTFVATLCIAIVWFPLFELAGVSGWLFMPMAKAVIFAMLASFILSRTLVPTMAKYMLKGAEQGKEKGHQREREQSTRKAPEKERRPNGFFHIFQRFQKGFQKYFDRFRDNYTVQLRHTLEHRWVFVSIALGFALVSLVLYYFNGREFYPETKGGTMQMHLRAPLGTRIEASGRIATRISKEIEKMLPGQVDTVISNCGLPVGPHNLAFIPTPTIGSQDCDLTIALKNDKSPVWDYRRTIRKGLKARYPGTVFTFQPADLTTKILNFGTPSPIDVQVKGFDLEANYAFARKLAGKLRHIPGAVDVTIQQTMQTPTLMVEGKRMFALGMDLAEKDIASNMLLTTSGSQQVDQLFWLDIRTGISYRINIYIPQPQVARIQDLERIPVNIPGSAPADNKSEILGNVANVSAVGTPGQVTHGDIMPLFDVYVSAEQRDLGHVLSDVQKVTKEMNKELPKQASLEIHGQAETMHQAYVQLIVGIALAVALVYLIIVVNFQSWLDPFIIISALPGALAGIAWSLFITHTYLSVPALTGAIMTMGTATANSILVVSHARERLAEHNDAFRAAIEAGKARLRPVLMTASAMIFGMLPMSMGNSPNAPLGRAVIGGLFVATVFTLFFVPCVYSIVYQGHAGKDEK